MSNPLTSSLTVRTHADGDAPKGQVAALEDKLRSLSIDRSGQAGAKAGTGSAAPAGNTSRRLLAVMGLVLGGIACGAAGLGFFIPTIQHEVSVAEQKGEGLAGSASAGQAPLSAPEPALAAATGTTAGTAVIGSGHVIARHELALGSRITGQVARVFVEAGQPVRAGTPLVELDRTDAELALQVALAEIALAEAAVSTSRAEVEAARAPLRRLDRLVPRGAASEAELEYAQLELARLEQEVLRSQRQHDIALLQAARARRALSLHTIVAPFDAVVADQRTVPGQVIVETGQSGPEDTVLMTLLDTSALYVDVDVAERNAARIAQGMAAELRLDAWPDRTFPAQVVSIEPRASREKGTVTARLEFAPGDTEGVLVNMAAKVTFAPSQTLSALN